MWNEFTITLFNLKILQQKDFRQEMGGAVYLNDEGRKKVITLGKRKSAAILYIPI